MHAGGGGKCKAPIVLELQVNKEPFADGLRGREEHGPAGDLLGERLEAVDPRAQDSTAPLAQFEIHPHSVALHGRQHGLQRRFLLAIHNIQLRVAQTLCNAGVQPQA